MPESAARMRARILSEITILLLLYRTAILFSMKLRSRQIIAVLVVSVYVMTGLLLDVLHHHAHDIALFSAPVVSSHDCGAKEIHLSIDKRNECVACSHSAQRQSAGLTEYLGLNTAFTCLATLPVLKAQPLSTDIHCSGTRGPPAA